MFNAKTVWRVDPVQSLSNLSGGIRNKAMRIALNAGAAPVKAATITEAPSELGNLKKSIRIKTKNYRNSNSWVAVIGASSTYKKTRKLKNKKRDRGGSKVIQPARYQPLVERGTKNMSGRKFLEAALNQARAQFEANFRRKFAEQIAILTSG